MSKYFFSFIIIVLIFTGRAFAQKINIGPKLGANIGKIDGAGFSDKYTLGYHAGGFLRIRLDKKWSIQGEVLWNQINGDTASNFSSIYQNLSNQDLQNPRLNYLSIPLLLTYKPGKIISFQAGPQFGSLLDNSRTFVQNGQNAFKKGDLSLLAGIQLHILSVDIYGRYMIGLENISDIPDQEAWKTTGFQVGLALALF
jgi:hypothetical protein